jgi:hypothetical protein
MHKTDISNMEKRGSSVVDEDVAGHVKILDELKLAHTPDPGRCMRRRRMPEVL